MADQAHHPHVVAEVLAPELRADAELTGELQDALLPAGVAEGPAAGGAVLGQVIQVARRGQLGHTQRVLRRGAADHHRQVVGRAGGGADLAQLGIQEVQQAVGVQHGPGLLVEEALVGRPAALGDEQELVLLATHGLDGDLGGQVVPRVLLGEHVEGGKLRVPQVGRAVGVEDAPRDGDPVVAGGQHLLALAGLDDGGAGVLAARQHPARGDVGVAQQLGRHEAVVGRGLGIVEDVPQLLQVSGAQQVGHVAHGLGGQQPDCLVVDLQEAPPGGLDDPHAVGGQQPVGDVTGAGGKRVGVVEFHERLPLNGTGRAGESQPEAGVPA